MRTKKSGQNAMLVIGVQKDAIAEARAAIMDILNTECAGDTAKVAACEAIKALCAIENVNISNTTFNG